MAYKHGRSVFIFNVHLSDLVFLQALSEIIFAWSETLMDPISSDKKRARCMINMTVKFLSTALWDALVNTSLQAYFLPKKWKIAKTVS